MNNCFGQALIHGPAEGFLCQRVTFTLSKQISLDPFEKGIKRGPSVGVLAKFSNQGVLLSREDESWGLLSKPAWDTPT